MMLPELQYCWLASLPCTHSKLPRISHHASVLRSHPSTIHTAHREVLTSLLSDFLEMANNHNDIPKRQFTRQIVERQFGRQLRAVFRLYDADLLDECEISIRELLNDGDIPCWNRMKALILLASIVEDAAEAKDIYTTAESLYPTMRRLSAPNVGEVDKRLEEIRDELDQLKNALDPDPDYLNRGRS
jgi:hypothetical protein